MNDEGDTVMFSKKWRNYIENGTTGEIERVGETFEMTLKAKKKVRWAEDGGMKYEGMEVDANDEDEKMLKEMSVVFRRQMS